jgi:hypothetical protein
MMEGVKLGRGKTWWVLSALSVTVLLTYYMFHDPEPSYKGHRLSEWLDDFEPWPDGRFPRFVPAEAEVREALIAIGTNNLSSLTRRIDFDPSENIVAKAIKVIPWVPAKEWLGEVLDENLSRREILADEAVEVFRALGPLGAPAVPKLTRILYHRGSDAECRAMLCLFLIGEVGMPAFLERARNPTNEVGILAVALLYDFTNSPTVRSLLMCLTNDPNPDVRDAAEEALAGREFHRAFQIIP